MQLGLRYDTRYAYDEPVNFSTHELRLFPRGDCFTRVARFEFRTNEDAAVRFMRDAFDNIVIACTYPAKAAEVRFALEVDLQIEERDPFDFLLATEATKLPLRYGENEAGVLREFSAARTEALRLAGWTPPSADAPRPTVSGLVELNRIVHETIAYERRETGAALMPAETLRGGKGACRDVALLLAELLRQMGLAARLTSGYLREGGSGKRRAEGSLHAWTEVYLPGAGWVGMDATNGVFCNENFVAAAVGLHSADISPILGSFYHKRKVACKMTSRLELIDL